LAPEAYIFFFFKVLRSWLSRQMMIAPITVLGSPRLAPYRAMPGTVVGLPSHNKAVGVSADGHASAPPSGAAAAAPPAGAFQCEPCTGKAWLPTGIVLPNEEPFDVAVRELLEETGLILTVDDLTILSGIVVRVSLHVGKYHLVYVYSASDHVQYVTANLRKPTNQGLTCSNIPFNRRTQ
jgi:hypothetical protein